MELSELDFNVVLACLRYVAMVKERLAEELHKRGARDQARNEFEFAKRAADIADRYEKDDPVRAWRAKKIILPPSMQ